MIKHFSTKLAISLLLALAIPAGGLVYLSGAQLPGALYTQKQADERAAEAWQYFKDELLSKDGAVVRTEDDLVVSEGQSYGMMLALQNDDREAFDRIWNWTRKGKNRQDLFAWKLKKNGEVLESVSAPDADVMIGMALIFAARKYQEPRYLKEAQVILKSILQYEVDQDDYLLFCSYDKTWFNPSYQMPAFFRLFAKYTGEKRWLKVAERSYDLIFSCLKEEYGNLDNGLVPDWCNRDGSSRVGGGDFYYDAMRTPYFIALDYLWHGQERAQSYLDKVIGNFFASKFSSFGDKYALSGRELSRYHVTSWVGALAGAAMGGTSNRDKVNFFNHLMERPFPRGRYRYYDICWLNFGLLLSSGNFKLY